MLYRSCKLYITCPQGGREYILPDMDVLNALNKSLDISKNPHQNTKTVTFQEL
jgi:hypothetical protein